MSTKTRGQAAKEAAGKDEEKAELSTGPVKTQVLDTQKTKDVMVNPDAFQIVFYMKHFRVTDIIVKVVKNELVIDACHREHADEHGLVSRSIIRKQELPKNIKLETLASSYTHSGYLVIHAEWSDKMTEEKQK